MTTREYAFTSLDCFTGERFDSMGLEARENGEIARAEQVQTSAPAEETSRDAGERNREERVEVLMKNVREFIRAIDVQTL